MRLGSPEDGARAQRLGFLADHHMSLVNLLKIPAGPQGRQGNTNAEFDLPSQVLSQLENGTPSDANQAARAVKAAQRSKVSL